MEHTTGYWIGFLLGAFLVGIFCGLFPFAVGLSRNKPGVASAALVCCTIGGFLFGYRLALPLAVIFTATILSLYNAPVRR